MMGINSIRNIVRKTFELIARPHRLIFKFPFLSLRLTHASFKYRSSGQSIVSTNERSQNSEQMANGHMLSMPFLLLLWTKQRGALSAGLIRKMASKCDKSISDDKTREGRYLLREMHRECYIYYSFAVTHLLPSSTLLLCWKWIFYFHNREQSIKWRYRPLFDPLNLSFNGLLKTCPALFAKRPNEKNGENKCISSNSYFWPR